MKKLILVAAFGLFTATQSNAQEVFNQVVSNAKLVLEDPKADQFLIAISQFKYTALQYLCTTAIKRKGGPVEADMLDRQAYALNHFIISYFSELAKAQRSSDTAQKDIMKKYWRATAENPMFNDADKEKTEAFLNDPECITPFSIDTNWELADQFITEKKNKSK